MTSGRTCPLHYNYAPSVFARKPDLLADSIYVVGGLYGNPYALEPIDRMAAVEPIAPRLVFNGDFHWLDTDALVFEQVQRHVLAHTALRGNVETELASDSDAGCGCAYPDSVPDEDVERSNEILRRLRAVARAVPGACTALAALPMHAVARVAGLRIAVVHGDAWSLSGWRFAHDQLHDPASLGDLRCAFEMAAVDGFASSHTGAPALKVDGERFVINNGSAGMANFEHDTAGLLTRISASPLPEALKRLRVYGLKLRDAWIDALRIETAAKRWLDRFDAMWPTGSAAALSYRDRIAAGPAFRPELALGNSAPGGRS